MSMPTLVAAESNMPRMELPLIVGQVGDQYELVTRIYDSLQDYTEVSSTIKVTGYLKS